MMAIPAPERVALVGRTWWVWVIVSAGDRRIVRPVRVHA